MEEIWKDIQGYEGLYQISSIGRVRSLNRINHFEGKNQIKKYQCGQLLKGKVLKYKYVHGYTNVTLYTEKHRHKQYQVHRLVAQAFIPNPNNYPQINHKDGNKLNNCVANLEWVTNQQNREHALKNGLHLCGEKCSWSKLKQKDVDFIRQNKNIHSNKELVNMFNVSVGCIKSVLNGSSWKKIVEKIC